MTAYKSGSSVVALALLSALNVAAIARELNKQLYLSSPAPFASFFKTIHPRQSPIAHLAEFQGFSSVMRYDNWDVILFPQDSAIPIQEFRTACYTTYDERKHPESSCT